MEAVLRVLRLAPDAVMSMGPPCSSYVYLNAGSSKRSRTRPYGDTSKAYIENANLLLCYIGVKKTVVINQFRDEYQPLAKLRLCSRVCLLIILATVRGVYICLEQPLSSSMRWFPDLVATGEAIQEKLGMWWEQSLYLPQKEFPFFECHFCSQQLDIRITWFLPFFF